MWKMSANIKITVNAKGEVVIDRGSMSGAETWCLPGEGGMAAESNATWNGEPR